MLLLHLVTCQGKEGPTSKAALLPRQFCLLAPLVPWQQGSFACWPPHALATAQFCLLAPSCLGNRAALLARRPLSWLDNRAALLAGPSHTLATGLPCCFGILVNQGLAMFLKKIFLKVSKLCPNCVQNVTKLCPKCVQIPPNVSTLCIIPGSPCQWRSEYFSR